MSDPLLLNGELLRDYPLPYHPDDDDKEGRGRALFIAGSRELAGAAILAGIAALRAGAGKLQIATSESIAVSLSVAIPEARVIAFTEDEAGCIDQDAIDTLVKRCEEVNSLTIGPGMQNGEAFARLVEALLRSRGDYPLVIDAAALGVLPELAEHLRAWPGGTVLLPHAGEMASLLDRSKDEVVADPLAAARDAAERFGAVVVIKGQWSHMVAPDGRAFKFLGGGVGLATSGSGDTLAGIVGGLCARGADPLTAAMWGVYLHGEAGRLLTREVGRIGFLAREIPDLLPGLMQN